MSCCFDNPGCVARSGRYHEANNAATVTPPLFEEWFDFELSWRLGEGYGHKLKTQVQQPSQRLRKPIAWPGGGRTRCREIRRSDTLAVAGFLLLVTAIAVAV